MLHMTLPQVHSVFDVKMNKLMAVKLMDAESFERELAGFDRELAGSLYDWEGFSFL